MKSFSLQFCDACGAALAARADGAPYCAHCRINKSAGPKLIAGCLVSHADRVLLCRRSIEPFAGLWNAPAGFQELGETLQTTAIRETWEEAGIALAHIALYSITTLPAVAQVHFMFRAEVAHAIATPGDESIDCAFFAERDMPWNELWYPETSIAYMRRYLRELRAGRFGCYIRDISSRRLEREFAQPPFIAQ